MEQINALLQYIDNTQAENTNPSLEKPHYDLWLELEDYNYPYIPENNSTSHLYAASETSSLSQCSMNLPSPTIYDAMSQTSGDTYRKEGSLSSLTDENFKQSQHSTRTFPALTRLQTSLTFAKAEAAAASSQEPPPSNNHDKVNTELDSVQPKITTSKYQMSQTSTSGETYLAQGSFTSLTDENFKQSQCSTKIFPAVTPLQTSFSFAKTELETPTSALRPVAPFMQAEAAVSPSQQLPYTNNEEANHELAWFQPKMKKSKYHHSA